MRTNTVNRKRNGTSAFFSTGDGDGAVGGLRGCLASEYGTNERSLFIKKKLTSAVFTAYAKPVCALIPFSCILFHLHFFVMAFTIPYFFQRVKRLIPSIHAGLRSSFRSFM